VLIGVALGCDNDNAPSSSSTTAAVRIVFMGSTPRRNDLPSFADACVNGVGMTHIHPSWRNFAALPLQPVPPIDMKSRSPTCRLRRASHSG
jgi:hypothetical protein